MTRVDKIMIKDVKTVSSSQSIMKASRCMKEYNIRHVPVVDEGKLVGIICKSDLARWCCEQKWDQGISRKELGLTTIGKIMTRDVLSIRATESIEKAAELLENKEFHALPVVDNSQNLIGIITTADIIRNLLVNFHGMATRGR